MTIADDRRQRPSPMTEANDYSRQPDKDYRLIIDRGVSIKGSLDEVNMRLKPARIAFFGTIAVLLFISWTIAQDIGHLGVSADPIPLVQARRPVRRFVVRNAGRNSSLALARPDPASKDLRADVSDIGGSAGKSQKPSLNNSTGSSTSTSNAGTVAVNTTPVVPREPVTKPETRPVTTPSAPTAEDFVAKAEDLSAKNNPRGAIEAFRQALALKPDLLDAQLGLADSLHDAKDYVAADSEYQKILAQNKTSAEAHRGRADTLYELKRYDDAIGEYQEAIKTGAADAGVYNNLANAYFRTSRREDRDRAVENYRKAIEKEPTWPDAYAGLANALRVQKQINEAQQAIEKSLQLAPNSSLAHSVAGRVYAELKDFTRANAEGQKAIDLAPKDSKSFLSFAYLNLGGILYAQQRFDEAIRAYVTAQSYDRNWAVPRNSLGNLYLAARRPLEASEEFEFAAKLEPKSPIIHTNLGNAYTLLQKYDAAITNFRIAAELDKMNPNPHSNMGVAFARQGKYNEAVNAFTEAVRIEPTNASFQQALAEALDRAGRKKEAREAYAKAEAMGANTKSDTKGAKDKKKKP
jgi:tetratricopeptide (TPR) repeat protein